LSFVACGEAAAFAAVASSWPDFYCSGFWADTSEKVPKKEQTNYL
jgi:hypothetical protein